MCKFCAQTGSLCKRCSTAYDEGRVDDVDIEISKIIYDAGGRFKFKNVIISKIFELENQKTGELMYVIFVKKGIDEILGNSNFLSKVDSELDGKIIWLKARKNVQDIVKQLLHPHQPKEIFISYIPPNSEEQVIVKLDKEIVDELPLSLEQINEIVMALKGVSVYFITE